MTAATLEYKCRRCDAVDDTQRPPAGISATDAVALAVQYGGSLHVAQMLTHACADGGMGVMGLIGAGVVVEAGDHAIDVEGRKDGGERGDCRAICSCGWTGPWRSVTHPAGDGRMHLADQRAAQADAERDDAALHDERARDAGRRE